MAEVETPVNKSAEPVGLTMAEGTAEMAKWLSDLEESPGISGDEDAGDEPEEHADPETDNRVVEGDDAGDEEAGKEEPAGDDEEEPRQKMVRVPAGEDGLGWELVPEQEARNRYLLRAQHTKATQATAEERRAAEAEKTAAAAERKELAAARETYHAAVVEIHEALKSATPPEPDWDALFAADPALATQQRALWSVHQEKLARAAAERDRAAAKVNADRKVEYDKGIVRERQMLLEKIPAWADPEVQKVEFPKVISFLRGEGFTDDLLNNIASHNVIVTARKAMLYDELQKKKPVTKEILRKKQAAVTTVEPGPPANTRRPTTDEQRAFNRLRKDGAVRDGAKLIETLI